MSPTGKNTVKSTCCYCGVGCGIVVSKDRKGNISIEGDKDSPVNQGKLCSKGMNLHYTVADKSDRLLYPQMRSGRDQPMMRVSWDTALDRAAAVFKTIIEKYGPDAVGFYGSGQFLTEEYYVINKLVKGYIGTNNLDTNSRLCMSSAVMGYKLALGEDVVPVSYQDIEKADCFFIAGANPAWCHPILFRRLEAHKEAHPEVKIIVVDPRRTQSCAIADLHLQITPGTDITLYNAIAKVLIEEGLTDTAFIEKSTDGFQELKRLLEKTSLTEMADICDVAVSDIVLAARYIGNAKGFISMWAMGLNQSIVGVNKNLALINLSLITGMIGKPGCGPLSLTGQPNAMGGREVGGMANLASAHRNLANPEHRKEISEFWNVDAVPEKPGYSATEMFQALRDGKLKAVWILCTNPLVSLPDSNLVEEALKKAKFVVVQDISNRSDTVKYADLVLPAAAWLEKTGTMTNSERRISLLNKAVDAPGEALPDSEILCRFAAKMGFGDAFKYKDSADIYADHAALTKGTNMDISGLSHERLKSEGTFQWPVPSPDHKGTSLLFGDQQFYTENKRAKIYAVSSDNASEKISPVYPLILTTGRIRDQWHTMTKTGKVQKLKQHTSHPFLEINPLDAVLRDIKDNQPVEIFNERGSVRVTAKLSDDIKRGVVFLPMHWGKILNKNFGRANNLTNNFIDPRSKEPDLKFSAVQVKKFVKEKQKIIVVGAGAAAFRFMSDYRETNQTDEIHVFCKEIHPFYNRVMLPDYLSGKQEWEKLVKIQEAHLLDLNVQLSKGISITKVNPEKKEIVDSENKVHRYDLLILATGSRSFVPRDVPRDLKGVFTMRSRGDADGLLGHMSVKSHVLVVGGGLLGLELAASLREMAVEVTIIQRISRLMERQLDTIGSELLGEEIEERGIHVIYNDEVKSLIGKNALKGVRLASGRTVECDSIVYAIGIEPNIEIARAAGLACNRGVIVNDYLQTGDPHIFAIGEIAEHNSKLFGITSAAEEQAGILVKYLNGDLCSYYSGSLLMSILKVDGLNLCSIGEIESVKGDSNYQEIIYLDKAKRYYKKCIVYQDKLVGAILIGDKSEFIEFKELIQNKTELSDKRLQLLLSANTNKEPMIGKLVCSCNSVGEGNISKCIDGGCGSLAELFQLTGAGMGCGSCRPEVKVLFEKVNDEHTCLS
jgi:ferredoxin-nitrate reductase